MAEGRRAYLGRIDGPDAEGEPARARALAGLYERAALGAARRRPGTPLGMDRADVGVAWTDGGAGREAFRGGYVPRAEGIRDCDHAAELLHDLAQAL